MVWKRGKGKYVDWNGRDQRQSDSKIGCVNKSDHGNNGGYNFARASGKSLSLFSVIQQCSSMPPRNII